MDMRKSLVSRDITKLKKLGYKPLVDMEQGVDAFVRWFKEYYYVDWI